MEIMTKSEAFSPIENQQNIPIDYQGYDFRFTRSWFKTRNQRTFSTFIPPKFKGNKPINMIQIGIFEGADLCWQFQNTLRHPDSRVVAIDPWEESRKINQQGMDDCYGRAIHNLHYWRKKIEVIRGKSQDVLPDLIRNGTSVNDKPILKGDWDLIIVDGDHHAPTVYDDAMYSFELVRKGGWLLFDDYYNKTRKKHHVQEGVSEFLIDHKNDVDLVWQHKYCICFKKRKRRIK